MNAVVIGSGPAGVAAARALVDAGHPVTILDAGDRPEPDQLEPYEQLGQLEPDAWPSGVADRLRGTFPVGVRSVGIKPVFGSLFPYAIDDPDLAMERDHVDHWPSLARGGLSNTWGASILPFRAADIADWPVGLAELGPHYEAVLRFVPLAGRHDELEEMFPLYGEPAPLRRTVQTERLLDHLRGHAGPLADAGISFGGSRLAVRADAADAHRCRYVGLCLYGCPYGSIYSASHTLDELIRTGVVYRSGVYVDRLQESAESVRILFHDRDGAGARGELTADRVFVAGGAVSSTRLILATLGHTGPRRLIDSHYFMLPMLTARAAPVSAANLGNTLAQLFLEIEHPALSRHTIHLQLYPYNDIMLASLAARLPLPPARLERALRPLLGRMVVIQGYVHSDESPGLVLTPRPDGVRLTGEYGPSVGGAVARRLAGAARLLGMTPLPRLIQSGEPGKGNHVGGSLPMRRDPAELETDLLGRPRGLRLTHVVDAAVFPSVPATTVTLTAMANAHRIASSAAAPNYRSG